MDSNERKGLKYIFISYILVLASIVGIWFEIALLVIVILPLSAIFSISSFKKLKRQSQLKGIKKWLLLMLASLPAALVAFIILFYFLLLQII